MHVWGKCMQVYVRGTRQLTLPALTAVPRLASSSLGPTSALSAAPDFAAPAVLAPAAGPPPAPASAALFDLAPANAVVLSDPTLSDPTRSHIHVEAGGG
eukprot:7102566-Prymnesium_polylepis.3